MDVGEEIEVDTQYAGSWSRGKSRLMYGKAVTRVTILLATVAALGAPKKW